MLELIGRVSKIIVTRTYRWDYKVLKKYKVVTYVNYSRVELERKLNLFIRVVDINNVESIHKQGFRCRHVKFEEWELYAMFGI